jgi:predicted small metal-binding protein
VGVDCNYVAKGETEEELWRDGTDHAVRDHGFKREDVNEKFKEEHKSFIKELKTDYFEPSCEGNPNVYRIDNHFTSPTANRKIALSTLQ